MNNQRGTKMIHVLTRIYTAALTLSMILMTSCGEGETDAELAAKEAGQNNSGSEESATTPGSERKFAGYVVNAFEVTVDGTPYRDLETFYTEEVARLPAKVAAAGYGPEYSVKFEAEIGFKDLFRNMDVYITAEGDRGYQGATTVTADGHFEIAFAESIVGDTFKVRANKRISVLLTKEGETKKICYNFSAVDRNIEKSESGKPIILSEFESRVTAYACPVPDTGGGINIPADTGSNAAASPASGLLRPGMSKKDTLAILGRENMTIESSTKWCWQEKYGEQGVCAAQYGMTCTCSVTFSADGLVESQSDIDPAYLDILAW